MPLGVLFRGNTEADIRKKIIQRGYIKGIIGLPPNLFYGTGIAACLIVIDKEDAVQTHGIVQTHGPVETHGRASLQQGDNPDEYNMLQTYKKLMGKETKIKSQIKKGAADLEILIIKKYPTLSIDEVKTIVVDKKWMHSMEQIIRTEMDNISHRLAQRIKELAERYETPLPQLSNEVNDLTVKVENHLKQMGLVW